MWRVKVRVRVMGRQSEGERGKGWEYQKKESPWQEEGHQGEGQVFVVRDQEVNY